MIAEAGGIPVIIPTVADVAELAPMLDGVLIPGGRDIDASRFGQDNHPEAVLQNPARYETEEALYSMSLIHISFFQWEFNLTVLAAVLAVLGYSVNESVVVFDRVRENFRKNAQGFCGASDRQRHYPHHVAYHHHSRYDTNHGRFHATVWR